MKYQNCPVEWMTTETEKIAKDRDNNTVRDAALLAGGVGAAGLGTAINHKPTSKVRKGLKRGLRIAGGLNVATGTLGAGASEAARRAFTNLGPNGLPLATMAGSARNASLARAGIGAAEIIGSKYINTNPVNKKLLAAKLGLITGGAVAAAAGAHGLMKEKKASEQDKKNPPSGWNRLARGLLGHIALPAIGATSIIAGAGLGAAADNVRNPYLKGALYGTGSLLALGGAATAGPGPLLNDSYQAYRYIQEH